MDRLPSGLEAYVADEELLARFLTQSKHFSREKKIVKYNAFLPNPRDGKTSVFRHSGEPTQNLWEIANRELANRGTVYGAGLATAAKIRETRLAVNSSEPPPMHANIEDWPKHTDSVMEKAAQIEVAKVVAEQAKLLLRPQ